MCFPGLEFYRVESASRKYFRFHLALVVSEEAMILNANWFGLELPFRYYPCWLDAWTGRWGTCIEIQLNFGEARCMRKYTFIFSCSKNQWR